MVYLLVFFFGASEMLEGKTRDNYICAAETGVTKLLNIVSFTIAFFDQQRSSTIYSS